tara:strand:- start:1010 stop:2296 length:1287 start_codon:yes stop_codon:yes gene_type:complete
MERGINDPCFADTFSYNNALIKPAVKEQTKKDFKTKYVLIDSRDRNYTKYPNSNDFQIMLNEPIKDVVEIELIQAHIPATAYLVNNNNNKIHYYIGTDEATAYAGTMYVAIVESGNWDATNIVSRVTEAFRVNDHDISVYYSQPTNKFSLVYNDDEGEAYQTTGAGTNIYLDFRNTTGSPPVVVKDKYDQNGNTDTSYKSQTMGEILGFSKNYYTTDTNNICPVLCSAKVFDEDGVEVSVSSNPPSYIILNKSKSEILAANSNFPITIGSVFKIASASHYVTGVVDHFMGIDGTDSDRVQLTWLSGRENGNVANNGNLSTNISDTNAMLGGDDYILLKIPNLERYEGRNTNIEKSYAKLHLGTSTRNIFFGRISSFSNIYECEPTLQKLDRLHIQYTDYHGNEYDFNNSDNSLIFAIKYKSQPGKYDF